MFPARKRGGSLKFAPSKFAGYVVCIAHLCNHGGMTSSATADRGATGEAGAGLGADLLAVVARINRYATQRIQMQLPAAQARLLSTIDAHGEARICDLAAVDHCSQPTMTTQVRRLEDAGPGHPGHRPLRCPRGPHSDHTRGHAHTQPGAGRPGCGDRAATCQAGARRPPDVGGGRGPTAPRSRGCRAGAATGRISVVPVRRAAWPALTSVRCLSAHDGG